MNEVQKGAEKRLRAGRELALEAVEELLSALKQARKNSSTLGVMPSAFEEYCIIFDQVRRFPNSDLTQQMFVLLVQREVDRRESVRG